MEREHTGYEASTAEEELQMSQPEEHGLRLQEEVQTPGAGCTAAAVLQEWERIGWLGGLLLEEHCTVMLFEERHWALVGGSRRQQEEGARMGYGYWQQEGEEPGSFVEELREVTEREAALILWGVAEAESSQFAVQKERHQEVAEAHLCLVGQGKEM